jgi:lipopolysaccharide export system protein LptA
LIFIFVLLTVTPFSADKVEIVKEGGESIVHLINNVVIEDEKTKITCSEARLNETRGRVVLIRNVKIVDKNGEITANTAIYYFKKKRGYLNGDVVLLTKDKTMSSDSLYYDGIEDFIEMYDHVQIEDNKNDLISYGDRGWYDLNEEVGYLTNKPKLEIIRKDKDPIKVSAQEFKLITKSSEFYGFDSVVAIVDSITIRCDTFSYNINTESGMMRQPKILEKSNILEGSSGSFELENKEVKSFSVENGWSTYYTKEGTKNVVGGSKIRLFFKEGKPYKIVVDGQPKGTLTLKKAGEDAGD